MTYGLGSDICPQCGSAAEVHSVQELADLAQARLGQQGQGPAGLPWQADGPTPGQGAVPGYAAEPRPISDPGARRAGRSRSPDISSRADDFAEDVAGIALSAATRLIGRAIGRRVQRTLDQQVRPTLAAGREAALRDQIAIAQRHPELRACLTDQVIFLAGGSRVVPLSSLNGMPTLEQADELVARLREG